MPYKIVSCGFTDPGLVRQNNEDVWGELPKLRLFVIADGMGGHRAGEIAAREAVRTLFQYVENAASLEKGVDINAAQEMIKSAIKFTNSEVYHLGKKEEQYRGMGTTLCALYFHDQGVVCAHVGDSRIYRFHAGKLEQITIDHSLVRELIDLGQLDEQQAPDFLYRSIITRAIGTEPAVEPTLKVIDVVKDDIYLMCTDGVTDLLSAAEIEHVIASSPNIRKTVKTLVNLAKEKGGHDNITVVITQIKEQ